MEMNDIPFPYTPYPTQVDAMTRIVNVLAKNNNNNNNNVMVLESPTGTGKSQILLNSALFSLFEIVEHETEIKNETSEKSENENKNNLENVILQNKIREEVLRLKAERKERMKIARKKMKFIKRQQKLQNNNNNENENNFLIPQDPNDYFSEHFDESDLAYLSSSSDSDDENISNNNMKNYKDLLSLVPTRNPKLYVSSRTHSQLEQLRSDLLMTEFAKKKVQYKNKKIDSDNETNNNNNNIHRLSSVHLASRTQLCINAEIMKKSKNNNKNLTFLCNEAMKYENSKEGKKFRQERLKQTKLGISVSNQNNNNNNDMEDLDLFLDKNKNSGCEFCAVEKLQTLLQYILEEREKNETNNNNETTNFNFLSLEALQKVGQQLQACPYLLNKLLIKNSDIIFLPYHYIIDSEQRNAVLSDELTGNENEDEIENNYNFNNENNNIASFKDAIMIIDEAHNVADFCRSVSTTEIEMNEIKIMIFLFKQYLQRYEKRLLTKNKQVLRELILFLEKLGKFEKKEEQTKMSFTDFIFQCGVDHIDVYVFLTFFTKSKLLFKLLGMTNYILKLEAENNNNNNRKREREEDDNNNKNSNSSFTELLKKSFLENNQNNKTFSANYYSQFIQSILNKLELFLKWFNVSDGSTIVFFSNNNNNLILKLVQTEPGKHTLNTLLENKNNKDNKIKSLLLAGGTLQPLQLSVGPLFTAEFYKNNILQNNNINSNFTFISEPHIIPSTSIQLYPLSHGVDRNTLFDWSYQNINQNHNNLQKLFLELTLVLLNMSRVVPAPSGIIIFFTSYEMENKYYEFLISTKNNNKESYFEELNENRRIFREGIIPENNNNNNNTYSVEILLNAYKKHILGEQNEHNNKNKAFLFSVLGGKLSEGINFSDALGRAVIVVGVPFPNLNNEELLFYIKQVTSLQNNNNISKNDMENNNHPHPKGLQSAAEWSVYQHMAMRVVNQSIGRCIRHIHDYAVVLLLDYRYDNNHHSNKHYRSLASLLSPWMMPSVKTTSRFGDCFSGVRDFFANKAK